jgi:hypothetical protein
MKFNKLIKAAACAMMLAGGIAMGTTYQPTGSVITVQAKTKSKKVVKVKYKNLSKKAYHVTTGTFYSTSYLKKANHLGVHYKTTTFYTYKQGTVTRANGTKSVYYYVKSSNGKVKGWIWHSYLKKGAPAKKTTSTKSTTTKNTSTTSSTSPATTTTSTGAKAPITAQVTGATATTNSSSTSSNGTATTQDEAVSVTVSGPLPSNETYASGSIKIKDGATAFTVLQTLCSNAGISLGYTGSGSTVYVNMINGHIAGTSGNGGGWIYSVNGVYPKASAGGYAVHDGDIVNWQWTTKSGDRGYNF